MQEHYIDILEEIIETLRDTSSIIAITDNSDNTYTIQVASLENLENGDYVDIENTPNFNNTSTGYVISSINSVNRTFVINRTSGLAISTFGTYTARKPYFYYEKFNPLANELSLKDKNLSFKTQKYPLIFLLLDGTIHRFGS